MLKNDTESFKPVNKSIYHGEVVSGFTRNQFEEMTEVILQNEDVLSTVRIIFLDSTDKKIVVMNDAIRLFGMHCVTKRASNNFALDA